MRYHHRFAVNAPLDAVVEFHRQSSSMAAITPPPIIVRLHKAPAQLADGDQMAFTMWLGPLPIRWLAQIETIPGPGFIDRQLEGPFAKWEHRHTFERINATTTAVIDEVTAELSEAWFWKTVGLGMWISMPILFAFRSWKTKRLLEKAPVGASASSSSSHRPAA
ncbi:MAG: hypothetical protein KDE53_23275 [Caldilineaceae bacterium]|nr:hypothetical protein [Caldilineaceae bacterium]